MDYMVMVYRLCGYSVYSIKGGYTMSQTTKKDLVYQAMVKSKLFDMDKIELKYNQNGMLCIRDYTYKIFKNGIAILNHINYFNKTITLDILKPNYLIDNQMILQL